MVFACKVYFTYVFTQIIDLYTKNENNLHETLIKNYAFYTIKKGPKPLDLIAICDDNHYLFITYIVTSKPNLISVADGVVHMVYILSYPSNLPVNTSLST